MRVSWNWLNDFVDLEGLSPEHVAERLTLAGLEVEGIESLGAELDGVVVARIISRDPHPDADRLSVCVVDAGAGEPLQIVCGASNMAAGDHVPLATVGARLPGDLKIRKSKIRGVESSGMLCAATELGLAEESDGLLLLDRATSPGTAIADALGLRDTVIEIALTPNRPDCLSMRGVAREIAVLLDRPLRDNGRLADHTVSRGGFNAESRVRVHVDDPSGCPRYGAIVLDGVTVGPSPEWLQQRLRAVGQRPINNLVDVTNYLNLELGQPLHAFDLRDLQGSEIRVRRARAGEVIRTLDGVDRTLDTGDLVIADATRAVAIAGVMGGENAEVRDDTTTIVIECANFDPGTVRRTARRLRLHTESSHRFERGVDPRAIPTVLLRAAQLVAGTVAGQGVLASDDAIDVVNDTFADRTIELPHARLEQILGVRYEAAEVQRALSGLGLEVSRRDDTWVVSVPPRRADLERPIDLVEEVARVVGYDRIAATRPLGEIGLTHERRDDAPVPQRVQTIMPDEHLDTLDGLRMALQTSGFHEAVSWGIGSSSDCAAVTGTTPPHALANPLSAELDCMRTTLLPGLLRSTATNLARRVDRIALYEIARTFPEADLTRDDREHLCLAGILAGQASGGWATAQRPVDIHDLTGAIEAAAHAAGRALRLVPTTGERVAPWMHPGVCAAITRGDETIGAVAAIHPDLAARYDITVPTFAFELRLDLLLATPRDEIGFRGLPRTPGSRRDVALLVSTTTPWHEVEVQVAAFQHKYLEDVRLFDVYQGRGVPDGMRSLAISSYWRHPSGSLTDEQVDRAQEDLVLHLEARLDARRRA